MNKSELERFFLDQFPGNIFWKDKDGKVLAISERSAKLYGYETADEILGKRDHEFIASADVDQVRKNDFLVMESGKEMTFIESANLTTLNKKVVYIVKKFPLRNEAGEIVGVQGLAFDYTREIQQILQEKAAHEKTTLTLQTIVDNMPGNVYWHDRDGVMLGCNAVQAKDIGFDSPADLIGKNLRDIYSLDTVSDILRVDEAIMDSNSVVVREEGALDVDHGRVYLSTKAPLHDSQDKSKTKVIGIVGISIDITEKKKAEQEVQNTLHQYCDLLGLTVNEFRAFHQVARVCLDSVRKESLTDMQASVLHELDQMLESKRMTMQYVSHIIKHVSGIQEIDCSAVDVLELLKKPCESFVRHVGDSKNVILSFPKGLKHFMVRADAEHVGNALTILMNTAEEQTLKNKVEVALLPDEAAGVMRIQVIDYGKPYTEAFIDAVLSSKRAEKNIFASSIRIGYAKHFIEGMQGKFGIVVDAEKGNVFQVALPLVEVADYERTGCGLRLGLLCSDAVFASSLAEMAGVVHQVERVADWYSVPEGLDMLLVDEADYQKAEFEKFKESSIFNKLRLCFLVQPNTMLKQHLSKLSQIVYINKPILLESIFNKLDEAMDKKRILMVEDERFVAQVVSVQLTGQGYSVEVATTGEEGVEKALAADYDLIMMDIGLPGINGMEAAAAIKEKSSDQLIMAFSAMEPNYTEEQLMETKCFDGIAVKGIEIDDLVEKIRTYLD